jgi:hypothetical protein
MQLSPNWPHMQGVPAELKESARISAQLPGWCSGNITCNDFAYHHPAAFTSTNTSFKNFPSFRPLTEGGPAPHYRAAAQNHPHCVLLLPHGYASAGGDDVLIP